MLNYDSLKFDTWVSNINKFNFINREVMAEDMQRDHATNVEILRMVENVNMSTLYLPVEVRWKNKIVHGVELL